LTNKKRDDDALNAAIQKEKEYQSRMDKERMLRRINKELKDYYKVET
jgi:hypothetical protein